MDDKEEHYYRGNTLVDHEQPLGTDHGPAASALGAEIHLPVKRRLQLFVAGIVLLGAGLGLGLTLAPDTPRATQLKVEALQAALERDHRRIAELEQAARGTPLGAGGKLGRRDKERHEREGRRYAKSLRKVGAQAAGDLMEWFVGRWNQLLDAPQADDRVARRAEALALLVGGMAANVNPGDYVPWQAEFLGGNWLGELHFDLDGDGRPGARDAQNPHDGFANTSVCQVAMAINQLTRDAQVLMMPEMRCDRPEARMSVFLQGRTVNDAIDEFVRAVKEQGFVVVERTEGKVRLVLVGQKPPPREDD